MPRLWTETIDAHRREVREAILDTTAALVSEQGLRSVTMSRVAAQSGIGRATLYRYFPDVEAILFAWHERRVNGHLGYLTEIRDRTGGAGERLQAVLEAFALITHESHRDHGPELAAFMYRVHHGGHVAQAQQQLRDLLRDLLVESIKSGEVRSDVTAGELASYCLHALAAASTVASKAAVRRLVSVTLAGLRPPRDPTRR